MTRWLQIAMLAIALCNISHAAASEDIAKPLRITSGWSCYRNEYASVVLKENTEEAGTLFFIRKTTQNIDNDCNVNKQKFDVLIDGNYANFFIRLVRSFLILDNGTGAARTLKIYDVPSGKSLISVRYSDRGVCDLATGCGNKYFKIVDQGVIFWRDLSKTPNKRNCKNFALYMKRSGSAAVVRKTMFEFESLQLRDFREERCEQRE